MTVFNSIAINSPLSAFGQVASVEPTPQVQIRFPYNTVPLDIGQVLTNNASSSVTVADAQASVTCGGANISITWGERV